jgi:hypothetical protein
MKHAFTQSEFAAFTNEGRTILVGFRSAANIVWSHGARGFILSPLPTKAVGLPFTLRGRREAVTPENFNKMLNY